MPSKCIELKNLESLVGPYLDDGYDIVDYSTKSLTAPGDNYGSTILALTLQLRLQGTSQEKTVELVAKMAPISPMFFQFFQVPLTFPKESSMYTTVARTLAKHQIEYQVPEKQRLNTFCKCLGTRRNLNGSDVVDNDAVLVLENLKVKGFGCGLRAKGFNKQDTEFILKHLARFHAVPIAIRYLKSEVFEKEIMPSLRKIDMSEGMPENMMMDFNNLMKNTIQGMPEVTHLTEDLLHMFAVGSAFASNTKSIRKSAYNTICHNDFWVNNMMLQWDKEGRPQDIKIVDFQTTHYNSAAIDLLFFLFTSVESNVLVADLDSFLRLYFDELIESLGANGCPLEVFTWESFMEEANELAKYELGHIIMMTKILLLDGKKLEGQEEVPEDVMLNPDLVGPEFYNKLKLVILMFQKRNWLIKA